MIRRESRTKNLLPFIWIFLIIAVSVVILNFGTSITDSRKALSRDLQQADQARQILSTLAFGAKINPYILRASKQLNQRLKKLLKPKSPAPKRPDKAFFKKSFPEHEIWVFSYKKQGENLTAIPVFYPEKSKTSRRGMGNILLALEEKDFSSGKNKQIDFLFGPGLKVKSISQRKGRPTRIIYQNRYQLLVWDSIVVEGKKVGGYFLLIPDSNELPRYAMARTSIALTRGKNRLSGKTNLIAGYFNLFSQNIGSVYPSEIFHEKELVPFLAKWKKPPTLKILETNPVPFGEKAGQWKVFTRSIPDSTHLAYVFLKKENQPTFTFSMPDLVNAAFLFFALLIFAAYIFNFSLPSMSLRTRFSLLFLALAAIPFSLLFSAADLYLEELRISMTRDAKQTLQEALSSFDFNVEDIYLLYQNEFKKLHEEKWIHDFLKQKKPVNGQLDQKFKEFMRGLSPALPWGSLVISNPEGKSILTFRSPIIKEGLEGYMKFNRIGIIEAMRKRNSMPSISQTGKDKFITDEDITLKTAYEAQIKLPILHTYSNTNVGRTIQISFGNLSIVRIVDYFPSEKSPRFGISVAWLERDLDNEFSIFALKKMKKEHPSIKFEIFRKENDELKILAKTHKNSNLQRTALSASMRDGFAFYSENNLNKIEIAFPSSRRPGIFLAGAMGTEFIEEKLDLLSNRFSMFFLLGFLAIFYFRNALFKRLILPLLLLEKNLRRVKNGVLVKLPQVLRTDELRNIYDSFNEMIEDLKARNRLLSLVSGAALKAATNRSDSGEDEKPVSVVSLISDIRSFTTLCEKHNPEIITSLLNLHFDRMSRIIHAHGGEVGRFVGDAIEASFYCSETNKKETIEKAVKASLLMLESIKMINSERIRQNLFTYKIGVGLAFGSAMVFTVGKGTSRTEVLQLGTPLKNAALLESVSRNFPECPLIVDKIIGKVVSQNEKLASYVQANERDALSFYAFISQPPTSSLVEISNADSFETVENANKGEDQAQETDSREYDRICENFITSKPSFYPGLILLVIPFLIGLLALYSSYDRNLVMVVKKAHQTNLSVLNDARSKNLKQEIVGFQFQAFIDGMRDEMFHIFKENDEKRLEILKSKIENKLDSFGLKMKEAILIPFQPIAGIGEEPDSLRARLKVALQEGLRCYDSKFNRYLLPDLSKLSVFEGSVSDLVFSRDARACFIQVSVASEPCWLYWQPILKPYSEWKYLWVTPVSWQMKLYGGYSQSELNSVIDGGLMVLCDTPESVVGLKCQQKSDSTLFARLDVKNGKVDELQGEIAKISSNKINELARTNWAKKPSNSDSELTKDLLAIVYGQSLPNSDLIVDKTLISGKHPELSLAVSSIWAEKENLKRELLFPLFLLVLGLFFTAIAWILASKERGLARSVIGQILGSFFGTVLIPAGGIFLILTLLQGDWKENLLEKSKSEFQANVEQIEEQLSFHQVSGAARIRRILKKPGINRYFSPEISPAVNSIEGEKLKASLHRFLNSFYDQIYQKSRALGLNYFLLSGVNGLSEALLVYGTLAAENDPMKRAFSFHANRIVCRINPKATEKASYKANLKKQALDEIFANQIFDILGSTYGDDASLELLFGQGRSVTMFGGYARDVFYQEFVPDPTNPLGIIYFALTHFQSNRIAMGRIAASMLFKKGRKAETSFDIYTLDRVNAGMPVYPENGERFPFLREIGRQSIFSGQIEKSINYMGEDYFVFTHHSKVFPQFIFLGLGKMSSYSALIRERILLLVGILLGVFALLAILSFSTSSDITFPLNNLLDGISRVKKGDYKFSLSFDRDDELEEIASAFTGMVEKLSEKNLLSRMVSESAAEMASSEELEMIALRGQKRMAAVAYFGINSFEEMIYDNDFTEMKGNLNDWVELVCSNVIAQGGEIDKIMEGKILAVFFARNHVSSPVSEEDCRRIITRAFTAAAKICDSGFGGKITSSCGIHLGEVISGLMGNEERRDHTSIGDPVNLAARCFSMSENDKKVHGIISTEQTVAFLNESFVKTDLGLQSIKGKQEPQRLFQLT